MSRRALGHVLLVLTVTVVAACGSEAAGPSAAAAAPRGTATVTLDVFSGVPNPSWVLDADQAAEFLSRWDVLTVATASDYPALLGYRGMIVDFADGSGIWVSSGIAVADGGAGALARTDPGRALELWLLDTAAGKVDGALLESIRSEIGG